MKNYKIDFTTNTITVTKKFADAASKIGTPEFALMCELRKMDMRIDIAATNKKKSSNNLLTYKKMENFIANSADGEAYLEEYKAVKELAKSQNNACLYVNKWFKATFPNYDKIPEFDENNKRVNTPIDYEPSNITKISA